jgi:hypothetical protein
MWTTVTKILPRCCLIGCLGKWEITKNLLEQSVRKNEKKLLLLDGVCADVGFCHSHEWIIRWVHHFQAHRAGREQEGDGRTLFAPPRSHAIKQQQIESGPEPCCCLPPGNHYTTRHENIYPSPSKGIKLIVLHVAKTFVAHEENLCEQQKQA